MKNAFKKFLAKLAEIFTSGRAQAAFDAAVALVPTALPIVETIAAMTPTRADDQIVALFEHFGMPYVEQYLATPPDARGYVLLHVATQALAKRAPGVPTNILNLAVQSALTAQKADAKDAGGPA